jgi:hypothetical protein
MAGYNIHHIGGNIAYTVAASCTFFGFNILCMRAIALKLLRTNFSTAEVIELKDLGTKI